MSETTQTKAPRQRRTRKPQRFAKLIRQGENVVLTSRQVLSKNREQLDNYTVESIPADYGRRLLLFKEDGTSYAVRLSGPDSECDCKGHASHGHCKHVDALLALERAGKL